MHHMLIMQKCKSIEEDYLHENRKNVMAVYPDNDRIGYTYNCFVAESGELVILDENNDNSIFVGAMNTDGTMLECDGTVWSCAD